MTNARVEGENVTRATYTMACVPRSYRLPGWGEFKPGEEDIRARPWWRDMSSGRRMGLYPDYDYDFRRRDGKRAGSFAQACRIDAEEPLPHPGYRVGQIWVLDFIQLTLVLGPLTSEDMWQVPDYSSRYPRNNSLLPFNRMVAAAKRSLDPGSIWSPSWHIEDGLQQTCLLHDPCRPDLAPWVSPPDSPTVGPW